MRIASECPDRGVGAEPTVCEQTACKCQAPRQETCPNDALRVVNEASLIGSTVLLFVVVDAEQSPFLHRKNATGWIPLFVEDLQVERRSNLASLGKEQQQREDKPNERVEEFLHDSTVCAKRTPAATSVERQASAGARDGVKGKRNDLAARAPLHALVVRAYSHDHETHTYARATSRHPEAPR